MFTRMLSTKTSINVALLWTAGRSVEALSAIGRGRGEDIVHPAPAPDDYWRGLGSPFLPSLGAPRHSHCPLTATADSAGNRPFERSSFVAGSTLETVGSSHCQN